MPDVVLAILVLAPLAVTLLLKSNAALAFLALCAGFVVISFTNINIQDLTKNLSFQLTSSTFNLILLTAPYVLTLLLRRKAFNGQAKAILQYVAALCGGGLLALVAVPLLNESVRLNFANSWAWNDLQKIQTPLIVAGVVISLGLVWFHKPAHTPKKHK